MKTFLAYEVALEINRTLSGIVEKLRKTNPALAGQLERTGPSIALNVAEGNRREGKDRNQLFRVATGSAAEVWASIDVARCWGQIDEDAVTAIVPLLDREIALLRGLIRKNRV